MSFQSEFVNPMRASRRYKEWAVDSPLDAARFDKYAAAIAAGKRPTIPRMATPFGKALVGAGKPWLPPAAPPPAPPPVVSSSVFAGRGCFTAHDPLVLVREGIADRFDWVALKGDGGDHCNPGDADALEAAGVKRIILWYSWDGSVSVIGTGAWIGQAEGQGQLDSCLAFAAKYPARPQALVTNVYMSAWPAGWYCLGEAYVGTNPNATPAKIEYEARKRGATEYSPVFSVYDGSSEVDGGRKVPLKEYRQMWPGSSWAVYTAEYLDAADIAYLKALPR